MPVRALGQARLHQHRGHGHPHGHLHRVQHEHAQVQAQQVAMAPQIGQAATRCIGVACGLRRHHPQHDGHARQRQRAGEPEQPRQPDSRRQGRRRHQRDGEHQPDAAAHQRHGLGAHGVARLVGQQRRHGRRDGPGTLQCAAHDQPGERVRQRRQQAARREHQQPGNDHALAPQAVRGHAQWQLQHRLREAIDTHRQADQRGIVSAGVLARLQGKHGQHKEQPQHAQREDQRQAEAGAALQRGHAGRGGCGGGRGRWQSGVRHGRQRRSRGKARFSPIGLCPVSGHSLWPPRGQRLAIMAGSPECQQP